jgi:hypothetical protein
MVSFTKLHNMISVRRVWNGKSFGMRQSSECVFSIRDDEGSNAELNCPHVAVGCGYTLFLRPPHLRGKYRIADFSNDWVEIECDEILSSLEFEQSYIFRNTITYKFTIFFVCVNIRKHSHSTNSTRCCFLPQIGRSGSSRASSSLEIHEPFVLQAN